VRVILLSIWLLFSLVETTLASWRLLVPGLDLGTFPTTRSSTVGESPIVVLRIDPKSWELVFLSVKSKNELPGLTPREWSAKHRLHAVINSGMFAKDYLTHVGHVRFRDNIFSPKKNQYQSVAAFDPRRSGLPRFRIFDLDAPRVSSESIARDYRSAIQNLRLIKRPKINRWPQQEKRWSEAALGEDSSGRILFIFCRSPFSVHDLNQELLSSGIGLVCAQHLEGGPPAQLYLDAGSTELELVGSYETSIRENDGNVKPWPLPSVLGIRQRTSEDRREGLQ
jgi:hypothetical protein